MSSDNSRMRMNHLAGTCVLLLLAAGPAIAKSAKKPDAVELNNRGVAAMNAGKFKESIRLLNQAIEIAPDDSTIIQNLSMAMNNLAVYYLGDTRPDLALTWLERAMKNYPDGTIRKNLAQAYVMKGRLEDQSGRPELALQHFRQAVSADPQSPQAHEALGRRLYSHGQLKDAAASIQRAYDLDPRPDLQTFLEKIGREEEGEKGNFEYRGTHFRISYSPAINSSDVYDAYWELERAYQAHRIFLGDAPGADISVVFYSTKEKFTGTHDLTSNVAGIYDGKVRLPIPEDPDWNALRNTMSHEVAHAFLFDIGGADIPTWINEGLAELLSAGMDRPTPSLDETLRLSRRLIPLANLSAALKNLKNSAQASLAYDQSYAIARYLRDRFGVFGIRRYLDACKRGLPEDDAIQQSFFMSRDMLQQSWELQIRK